MSLKRETFADYYSQAMEKDKKPPQTNFYPIKRPEDGNYYDKDVNHGYIMPVNIHSNTERTVSSMEIKSLNDNVIKGAIQHMLEDELPDIRMHAIEALVVLGKIFNSGKNEQIKELLLYFLNDDFDQVRIKGLQALQNLFGEIALSDFEIDTLQFNLKENVYGLRVSIYRLLCNFVPQTSQ